MAEIKVTPQKQADGFKFIVQVSEQINTTTHHVTMSQDFIKGLGARASPEKIVKKSFQFLLEREPKESILKKFDISVISRYFPEYNTEIKKRLE